jgi:hypothetical protein
MSFHDKKLTVDEVISELTAISKSGRGHYKVSVEEYVIDDGYPDMSESGRIDDKHETVNFSGTP